MLPYPGDGQNNKEDVFKTKDLVSSGGEDFSFKGYLRFAKLVLGEPCVMRIVVEY